MLPQSNFPLAAIIPSTQAFLSDRVSRAIAYAAAAHAGQTDKDGSPHILHVIRVVSAMTTPDEQVVAALHDVLEDTSVSYNDIIESFGLHIAAEVRRLTRPDALTYREYIFSIAKFGSPLAKAVKLADLSDNYQRSAGKTQYQALARRYTEATKVLLANN